MCVKLAIYKNCNDMYGQQNIKCFTIIFVIMLVYQTEKRAKSGKLQAKQYISGNRGVWDGKLLSFPRVNQVSAAVRLYRYELSSVVISHNFNIRFFNKKSMTVMCFVIFSETWVTTKRDMTRLEAAERRFLKSVTGYTRLDKMRCDILR